MLLNEIVDQKLLSLVNKHSLKMKNMKIDDFNYNDSIAQEFQEIGYELRYNQKSNKFDVIDIDKDREKQQKAKDNAAFTDKDINGRKIGFKSSRKMI